MVSVPQKGPCRDEAPPAYPLFCLSKGLSRSDQPTKFEALGLTRSLGFVLHIGEIRPVRAKFAAEQFHARIAPNNAMTLSRIDWL